MIKFFCLNLQWGEEDMVRLFREVLRKEFTQIHGRWSGDNLIWVRRSDEQEM
jgi:hypothetical protein